LADSGRPGRPNQRQRTRKDLLEAAARLMREGRSPTLEDVAEAALVSRATAYRYFTGAEPLLVEAALDIAFPDEAALDGDGSTDPVDRQLRAESAVAAMVRANEAALRAMLAHSVQRGGDSGIVRQNRRTPLIEAALAPGRATLDPEAAVLLERALALVIGTEAMVVFKDVLALDEEEASRVKQWMIRALVEAARKPPAARPSGKG
jgi:AcrR family transcriptional regulator